MKLTPVLQGTPIPQPAVDHEGTATGYTRKPAPLDGYLLETSDMALFIPERDLDTARVDLKLMQEKRPGRRRR